LVPEDLVPEVLLLVAAVLAGIALMEKAQTVIMSQLREGLMAADGVVEAGGQLLSLEAVAVADILEAVEVRVTLLLK
jgi:hypothetical protein